MIPPRNALTIGFAHVAYQLAAQFARRNPGIANFEVRSRDELERRIGEADVLVISGLWRDDLLDRAERLRFIQSIGAGTDQFPRDRLRGRGIRLASASGVNARAVAEHAMALILALARRLPEARDNQNRRLWRDMIGDLAGREDELGGKTLLVVGLGAIGGRLARLAKAFDMRVVGIRCNPAAGGGAADRVLGTGQLQDALPEADFVALACPLTEETEKLIDATAFGRMKPSASLINVARDRCVDESALIAALRAGRIAGAAIDVAVEEPLPAASPLWEMANLLVTPHTAGETRRYEDNVLDILPKATFRGPQRNRFASSIAALRDAGYQLDAEKIRQAEDGGRLAVSVRVHRAGLQQRAVLGHEIENGVALIGAAGQEAREQGDIGVRNQVVADPAIAAVADMVAGLQALGMHVPLRAVGGGRLAAAPVPVQADAGIGVDHTGDRLVKAGLGDVTLVDEGHMPAVEALE
jgi:D-2-hydroxyacid dehydrogenase (NADP+)